MEEPHRLRPRDPATLVETRFRANATADRSGEKVRHGLVHVHPVRGPIEGVSHLRERTKELHPQARFLVHFTDRGFLVGLSRLQGALRQDPHRLSRLPEEEGAPFAVHHDGTGRAPRTHGPAGPRRSAADPRGFLLDSTGDTSEIGTEGFL